MFTFSTFPKNPCWRYATGVGGATGDTDTSGREEGGGGGRGGTPLGIVLSLYHYQYEPF